MAFTLGLLSVLLFNLVYLDLSHTKKYYGLVVSSGNSMVVDKCEDCYMPADVSTLYSLNGQKKNRRRKTGQAIAAINQIPARCVFAFPSSPS